MTLDRMLERGEGGGASLAQVSYSLEEGGWGAVADQEYRHRPVIAPGGYRWCPREGQQLLLLHTGDGDLCAGVSFVTFHAGNTLNTLRPGIALVTLIALRPGVSDNLAQIQCSHDFFFLL